MCAAFSIPQGTKFTPDSDQFPSGCFPDVDLPVGLAFLYQPIVDSSFRLMGVEALARGMVNGLPDISPVDFIPQVERNPNAERWLLTQLVAQSEELPGDLTELFVNASPNFLTELPNVLAVLKFSNPIVIELTERLRTTDDVEALKKKLIGVRDKLSSRGEVWFALDDIRAGDLALVDPLVPLGLKYIKTDPSTFPLWQRPAKNELHVTPLCFKDVALALAKHKELHIVMEGYDNIQMRTVHDELPLVTGQLVGEDSSSVVDRIFFQGFGVEKPTSLFQLGARLHEIEGGYAYLPLIGTNSIVSAIIANGGSPID